MFDKIEIFRMAQGLATHSAARHSTIAQNVAHADTPGFKARDLAPFADTYERHGAEAVTHGMRATRASHVFSDERPVGLRATEAERPGAMAPNGNNVSLETEMMLAAEAKGDHNRALAVYQTSLDILRTSLGRR